MSDWHAATTQPRADVRRARILDAVTTLTAQPGKPPTIRAIATHVGLSSSAVYHHLATLRRQGHIAPADDHAGILLTQEHES